MNDTPHKRPIILRGKAVSLGLVIRADTDFIYEMINDLEVNRFLRRPYAIHSIDDEDKYVRTSGGDSANTRVFAVIPEDYGDIAGLVSLHEINLYSGNAYVAYSLAKKFWGHGYTTEAVSLLMKYAFEILKLRKLHSSVFEPNTGSIRVLEKNGFKEIGRFHRDGYVPGYGYVDEIYFEVFNKAQE